MKKNLLLLIIPLLITACQQKAKTDAPTTDTTAKAPVYPYKIKHPDYWDIDTSHANTMVVLSALKAFETIDTASMKKYFADSVVFEYDGGTFKGTNSQFIKMSAEMAGTMKSDKLDVKDWEAVVSKDKKEEWVTVWYAQKWTDAKGVADSARLINDMQLKGGKIIKLDEYVAHFKSK